MVDSEDSYSLAVSREGIGELYPVLKDAFGNIIDGYHRKGENPEWHEASCPQINTPVLLALAQLSSNACRRAIPAEEKRQRIKFLIENGMKPSEIAKITGITERTVLKYTPQELKNPVFVESGRQSAITRKAIDPEGLQPTVAIPESISATTGNFVPHVRTFEEAAKEVAAETAKADESSFVPGEVEDEVVPDGCPICPCCSASLNLSEYEEIKQKIKVKFGKSIQMLLFSEGT
jgi:hypothetical protein